MHTEEGPQTQVSIRGSPHCDPIEPLLRRARREVVPDRQRLEFGGRACYQCRSYDRPPGRDRRR
eukprot:15319251-Alexandrium_andersonii.AAC.1